MFERHRDAVQRQHNPCEGNHGRISTSSPSWSSVEEKMQKGQEEQDQQLKLQPGEESPTAQAWSVHASSTVTVEMGKETLCRVGQSPKARTSQDMAT